MGRKGPLWAGGSLLPETVRRIEAAPRLVKRVGLIPAEWADGRLPWSEASFRKIVADLVEASGVRFSLKDFRSTFAQVAKDHGASIESVSRAMRHRSTKTTEAYYARISPKAAFQELRERCSPVVARVASSPE